ncbi:hypothetical protein [Sporosarcina sp. FSL K6-1508]|uniref:hypothetical protein n=1 Tax=Sporosarcina sp. FSL K6-1508 TaxID=2921553 RepID=UPI0030FD030F
MTFGTEARAHLDRKLAGLHALAENIGKDMEKTAKNNAAWTDRTGNTRQAIHGGADKTDKGAVIYLAHGSKIGLYHEMGTGIYGPKKRPIVPTTAQALHFSIGGKAIFAKSIKGMQAKPVIDPTADSRWPDIKRQVRSYWGRT